MRLLFLVLLANLLAVHAHGGGWGGKHRRLGENGHGIDQSKYHTMDIPMPADGGIGGAEPHPGPRPPPHTHDSPCKMDFWRFCAFRVPDMQNMEEIIECMKTHDEQLQPECKVLVDEASATIDAFHGVCDSSLTTLGCDPKLPSSYKPCIVEHLDSLEKPCLTEISAILMKHAPKGPNTVPEWAIVSPMDMGMGPGGMGGMDMGMGMLGLHHVIVKSILCAAFIISFTGLAIVLLVKCCCARRACRGQMCRSHCQQPQLQMGIPVQETQGVRQSSDPTAYAAMA
mmetsp:Transcript_31571/g.77421  ORF Transcript_31571/g.77421 Transcript_31571/m.77421 type:complete len:284 (-) Transcript_31571:168-1019(-)